MPGFSLLPIPRLKFSVWGSLLLLPGVGLVGQGQPDTSGSSGSSLLEQVYEQRIATLQDSLFLAQERVEATAFTIQQLVQSTDSLTDSLRVLRAWTGQQADSLSRLFIRYDRAAAESRQNRERLAALSDSIALSFRHEYELQALIDSLLIILARTQTHLAATTGKARIYADTTASLRNTLNRLREGITASEDRFTAMYDQMKRTAVGGIFTDVDSAIDAEQLRYLEALVNYRPETVGLRRRRKARRAAEELFAFRLFEITTYLDRMALRGRVPEALNLLAATYIDQKDPVRGTLSYLKTLFIYPDSEAAVRAKTELEIQLNPDSEIGHLFRQVALNPDSVDASEDLFLRYLNYLDHIRQLENLTARAWFIEQAQNFLTLYHGILQADKVLVWMAAAYHDQQQYHKELLTFLRIRSLHPYSRYLPQTAFATAEVMANNLADVEGAIDRYDRFAQEFPTDPRAPAALLAQAVIYQDQLRDYRQAGRLYRKLADSYPDDSLATVSLFRYADLLHNRLASTAGARAVYQEILSGYGQTAEAGIPALEGLATLSQAAKEYPKAADFYLKIFQRYPEAEEKSVAAILEAAGIYESRLKNIDLAIDTLHKVLDNYPDYPGTRSVQKRVQKLQKRRG